MAISSCSCYLHPPMRGSSADILNAVALMKVAGVLAALIAIPALLVSSSSLRRSSAAVRASGTIDVWILAGQSNTVGENDQVEN